MNTIWTCTTETWLPSIGDPDLLGWLTTLLYFGAAYLAFRCAKRQDQASQNHATYGQFERYFWYSTAILLALLAANKQLDIQTFVVDAGRCISKAQGWFGMRRGVQMGLAAAIAGMLGIWMAWILFGLRRVWSRMWLELLGLAAVFAFIMLRVLLFTHIYHTHIFGNNSFASRLFEILGPVLLSVAALSILKGRRDITARHTR